MNRNLSADLSRTFEREGPLWVPRYDYETPGRRYDRYIRRHRPLAAISLVQSVTNFNSSIGDCAVSISPSAGNFLVAFVARFGAGSVASTIKDNLTDTWSSAYSLAGSTDSWQDLFYLANIPGGITTVTANNTAHFIVVGIREYSGVATSSPLDQVIVALKATLSGTAWTSNSTPSPVVAGALLIGLASNEASADVSFAVSGAWGDGFKLPQTHDGDCAFMEDQLNVSAGTYNAAGNQASVGNNTHAAIVSFKPGAAGAALVPDLQFPTTGPSFAI